MCALATCAHEKLNDRQKLVRSMLLEADLIDVISSKVFEGAIALSAGGNAGARMRDIGGAASGAAPPMHLSGGGMGRSGMGDAAIAAALAHDAPAAPSATSSATRGARRELEFDVPPPLQHPPIDQLQVPAFEDFSPVGKGLGLPSA